MFTAYVQTTLTAILAFTAIPLLAYTDASPAPDYHQNIDEPATLSQSNNDFAIDVFKLLVSDREKQNTFLGPFSLYNALAMTYAGAEGNTAKEMERVLNITSSGQNIHNKFKTTLENMHKREEKADYKLTIANALWGQKGTAFKKSFISLVNKCYDAGLNDLDFKQQPEKACNHINRWVSNKTNDKISKLISPQAITPMTRLILTNAVYFKGRWADTFSKQMTSEKPFTLLNGRTVKTQMMRKSTTYNYTESENWQVLQLPYVKNDLAMVIFLPKTDNTLTKLVEDELNSELINTHLNNLQRKQVNVTIPKFKLKNHFQLATTLQNMGMPSAFDPNKADFSNMSKEEKLFISDVIHKTYIKVNEEGTEAAAATGVQMKATSVPTQKPTQFRADHPFVFLIRDLHNHNILFLGQLVNPENEK